VFSGCKGIVNNGFGLTGLFNSSRHCGVLDTSYGTPIDSSVLSRLDLVLLSPLNVVGIDSGTSD